MRNPEMSSHNVKKPKNTSNILWKTLDTFSKETSISGISNAGLAKSYFRSGCWLLIFAIFGAFTLYGFQDVVNDYLDWPVTTSIYIQHHNRVMFQNLNASSYFAITLTLS